MISARAADNTSSQPGPRKRVRKPKKNLSPDQAIRLRVTPDGRFAPADLASQKLCHDRGLRKGATYIAYVYEARDEQQWANAHQVGTFLANNVEVFHNMSSHQVLKKLQLDSGHGCEMQEIDLGALGKHKIKVPKSLAFGWIDNTEWTAIWRGISQYIRDSGWLGEVDADVAEGMQRLLLWEPTA